MDLKTLSYLTEFTFVCQVNIFPFLFNYFYYIKKQNFLNNNFSFLVSNAYPDLSVTTEHINSNWLKNIKLIHDLNS